VKITPIPAFILNTPQKNRSAEIQIAAIVICKDLNHHPKYKGIIITSITNKKKNIKEVIPLVHCVISFFGDKLLLRKMPIDGPAISVIKLLFISNGGNNFLDFCNCGEM